MKFFENLTQLLKSIQMVFGDTLIDFSRSMSKLIEGWKEDLPIIFNILLFLILWGAITLLPLVLLAGLLIGLEYSHWVLVALATILWSIVSVIWGTVVFQFLDAAVRAIDRQRNRKSDES